MALIKCQGCGKSIAVDDSTVAKTVNCQACGRPIVVPFGPMPFGCGVAIVTFIVAVLVLVTAQSPILMCLTIAAGVAFYVWHKTKATTERNEALARLSPDERKQTLADEQEQQAIQQWGLINPTMVCPHCQTKGQIRTKLVNRKKGVSGGKAAGVLVTGGWSLLVTGLSREESATQAHCDNCNNTWDF